MLVVYDTQGSLDLQQSLQINKFRQKLEFLVYITKEGHVYLQISA